MSRSRGSAARLVLRVVVAGVALVAAYAAAHMALIELGREVVVLRTREPDGSWRESRLWIVDHAGHAWLHGADSAWMQNLARDPIVEVERAGELRRFRAVPTPGPHPEFHERMREKYGLAERWVRFAFPDTPAAMPVRLDPL